MRYVKTFENFNQTQYSDLNEGIIGEWFRNTVMNWGWVKRLIGDYKEGAKLAAEYLEENPQVAEEGIKKLSNAVESGQVTIEQVQDAANKVEQFKGLDPAKQKQLEAELEKNNENYFDSPKATVIEKILTFLGWTGVSLSMLFGIVWAVAGALGLASSVTMLCGATLAVVAFIAWKLLDKITKAHLQEGRY